MRVVRSPRPVRGDVLSASRAVVAAALTPRTYRGADVTFAGSQRFFSSGGPSPGRSRSPLPTARGLPTVALGERVHVQIGRRARELAWRLTARWQRGEARAAFDIVHGSPTPTHTSTSPRRSLRGPVRLVTTDLPRAEPCHAHDPIVVVEGVDLKKQLNWDDCTRC